MLATRASAPGPLVPFHVSPPLPDRYIRFSPREERALTATRAGLV